MIVDQDRDRPGDGFVSTGNLPPPDRIREVVNEAYIRYASNDEGQVSRVYPALERASPDLFGVCLVGTSGATYALGDVDHRFTIMSVSKPFVFALVCQELGPTAARRHLGANATGLPFNSVEAIDRSPDGRTNPMVNPGAIMTTSLVPGATSEDKWTFIHEGLSKFAGRTLPLDDEVYASALATNQRNHGIANVLLGLDRMYSDRWKP